MYKVVKLGSGRKDMGGGAMLTPGSVPGGPHDHVSNPRTTTTNLHSHHHPSSSHLNLPLSANCPALHSRLPCTLKCSCLGETCTNILDSVDGREDRRGSYYDNIFGPVPSRVEVENAMADLQRFILRLSTSELELKGLQQMLDHYDPRMLQSPGYGRIRDSFRMLQTEPSVQRMVMSISSDKAVWDAILNNKAIQDLQGSLNTGLNATEEKPQSSYEASDLATLILKWILGIAKTKVVDLIEKFAFLVNEIFLPAEKEKSTSELNDLLEEKVRSSLLLSILIILIVVVTRSHAV